MHSIRSTDGAFQLPRNRIRHDCFILNTWDIASADPFHGNQNLQIYFQPCWKLIYLSSLRRPSAEKVRPPGIFVHDVCISEHGNERAGSRGLMLQHMFDPLAEKPYQEVQPFHQVREE